MHIVTSKQFDKELSRLSPKVRVAFLSKFELFAANEYDEILHNHKLHPPFENYRSINITGDYRLIYKKINPTSILLYRIGTHSQLYE